MTSFVLVHGGAHGAWCWARLVPFLEADPRVDAVLWPSTSAAAAGAATSNR